MTDHTERLVKQRRLDSETKAARLLATLDAMVIAGEPPSIAALARKARVSRRFVYDHVELRSEVERRAAEVADRCTSAVIATARVTAASLRADLENTKATNRRLDALLAALRCRLGQILGQDALADMHYQGVVNTSRGGQDRIDELEQSLFETNEELARRTDELTAARQINRELMARINRCDGWQTFRLPPDAKIRRFTWSWHSSSRECTARIFARHGEPQKGSTGSPFNRGDGREEQFRGLVDDSATWTTPLKWRPRRALSC